MKQAKRFKIVQIRLGYLHHLFVFLKANKEIIICEQGINWLPIVKKFKNGSVVTIR